MDHKEGTITVGDGKKINIIGKGTIVITRFLTLKNVLLVDGLKANLISISQLCDDNLNVSFTRNECLVQDRERKCILCGKRTSSNCYCVYPNPKIICNNASINTNDLWYQRLGHMNTKDLDKLVRKNLDRGFHP